MHRFHIQARLLVVDSARVFLALTIVLLERQCRLKGFLFALDHLFLSIIKFLLPVERGIGDGGVKVESLEDLPVGELGYLLRSDVVIVAAELLIAIRARNRALLRCKLHRRRDNDISLLEDFLGALVLEFLGLALGARGGVPISQRLKRHVTVQHRVILEQP